VKTHMIQSKIQKDHPKVTNIKISFEDKVILFERLAKNQT